MVNMATANIFLILVFVSGALTECGFTNLFITSPQSIEALNGSCLQIPCIFRARVEKEFDNTRKTFGLWIKETTGRGTVVFNSEWSVLKYPINITGNLKEKDCTTLFSDLNTTFTGKYYFRIMNWPYRATAVCDPVQIKIKDSPQSPRIEISGDLKEGESVSITCSALTPCPHLPPKLTWNLLKDSHHDLEENTNGTFTTKIQESITLSDQHDGYNITCSATYPVNEGTDNKTAEETKTLRVSYAPKNTSVSVSPSGLVSAGTKVNLTCSSRAQPPVSSFTWFKICNACGPMIVSVGEFYSINVTADGVYYCEARNQLGHETSLKINLKVKDEGLSNISLKWQAALGGILGIIVFMCVVVCIIWRLKSKDPAPQQTQLIQTGEQMSSKEPEKEESIHYGEIDFSKLRQEPSSDSAQDGGQEQDTVYAQVKKSGTTNIQTPTADSPEDLYANVKTTIELDKEVTLN